MTTKEIVGSGKYTYEVDYHWAKLPEGWSMPAAAVFGDSQDKVYCFNRDPDHPIVILIERVIICHPGVVVFLPFLTRLYWTKRTMYGS